ncbi:AAA+ ATPase domain-containing protein [Plasmodiophora brassicae]
MAAVVDDGVGHVWCVWDRGDRHVQLPFVAFTRGAKWGSRPASVRRLGRRVAAYSIRVSGGSRDCLGDLPVVCGMCFPGGLDDELHTVVEVLCLDDAAGVRQLHDGEFAMVTDDTVVEVQCQDGPALDVDIAASLLELDSTLSELQRSDVSDEKRQLLNFARRTGPVLVSGPRGAGKTTMVRSLARRSCLPYAFVAGCIDMRRRVEHIIAEQRLRPFVIVLDDVELLGMDDVFPAIAFAEGHADVIATITVASDSSLLLSGNCARFSTHVSVPVPTYTTRLSIIRNLLQGHVQGDALNDLCAHVAQTTPGSLAGDLVGLCRRVWTVCRQTGQSIGNKALFDDAAPRRPSTSKYRHRFGGYQAVRKRFNTIREQWVGHQTGQVSLINGILLHGPSGCGKTLLARTLSHDPFLNFVPVNAADLLSKYYGESEARIRQLFRQARSMTPCVLFFDDIDAIAASREREAPDDSGVQSRVLSTLLNELDGVEDRIGVFLLASSNRIDLIDSALLRPGRFDLMLELPMPTRDDRIEILRELTAAMPLDDDIRLENVVDACDCPTGAQLSSLVHRAGLSALQRDRNADRVTQADFQLAASILSRTPCR